MARLTLEKLVTDGRIHPGRIEEVYAKAQRDIDDAVMEAGEAAAFEVGVTDLKPEMTKALGRLKYRTSFGQNVLKHSMEVAHLCGAMAAELGANVILARRAGLLHDIGKAMDYDASGTHALTAAEFCRKQGESQAVVDAVACHHEEQEPKSVEDWLVLVGDAISASRPGARRETIETYLRRLEALEGIAKSFPGVEKCYAIHAGREIRILVEPDEVDDLESIKLARDISIKVENEMEYPGQIRVTVIRETRAVEYAK
jgi:ribonuclease Y